jgi:hypothetical protein
VVILARLGRMNNCNQCSGLLEEWETGVCEGCGTMTENQIRLLAYAAKDPSQFLRIGGICLVGQTSARGIGFVLDSMEKQGWIEQQWLRNTFVNAGAYMPSYRVIRITDAGVNALAQATGKRIKEQA